MTQQGAVVVEGVDGSPAGRAEFAFRVIYGEAFAEPPYGESEDDVAAAFRRFPSQVRKPAFRAALARGGGGEPVGMAYGHPLAADTGWWDELTEPVPEECDGRTGAAPSG